VKASLRKVAARTQEDLIIAIRDALAAITPEDARNWAKHSGYTVTHAKS